MIRPPQTQPPSPRSAIGWSLLALLALLVASCGKSDPAPAADDKDKEKASVPPKRPEELIREIASRPDRPPGFPTSLIGRSDRPPSRIFKRLSPSDREELDALAATYRSATEPGERIVALEAMSEHYSEDLVAVLREALADPDAEIRTAALGVLSGSTSPSVIPLAMNALDDPEESVRLAVPNVLLNIPDLAVVPALVAGLGDASESVRYAFLDAAVEMSPEIRTPVLAAGIESGEEKIRGLSLTHLKMEISHAGFDIIIGALDNPDPHFREEVSMQIDLLVGETFTNAADARAWWAENKARYDRDLFLKE